MWKTGSTVQIELVPILKLQPVLCWHLLQLTLWKYRFCSIKFLSLLNLSNSFICVAESSALLLVYILGSYRCSLFVVLSYICLHMIWLGVTLFLCLAFSPDTCVRKSTLSHEITVCSRFGWSSRDVSLNKGAFWCYC